MARIELRYATILFRDGYSNAAAVNQPADAPADGDTQLVIDTLTTQGVIPVSSVFNVVGSSKRHTVTVSDANARLDIDLDAGTGNFTISVAGNASANIAHNANQAAIQAAVDAITGVAAGDFLVTKTGADIVVKALSTGAFGNEAVTLTASLGSLTGGSPTSSQTAAGGVTNTITFTPALTTATGLPTDGAVITFGGRSLEVKVGDGNLEYTENRSFTYDLDRGRLSTVRQDDDVPMDVSLDFVWEQLTAISGADTPSIEDVLKRRGPAADWVSSSADQCEAFCIDIEIVNTPPCGGEATEYILLPDFRWEGLPHSIADAQVSMTGRCNATEAIISRAA